MSEPNASRLKGKTGMVYVDDLADGISETEQVNDDVADQQCFENEIVSCAYIPVYLLYYLLSQRALCRV